MPAREANRPIASPLTTDAWRPLSCSPTPLVLLPSSSFLIRLFKPPCAAISVLGEAPGWVKPSISTGSEIKRWLGAGVIVQTPVAGTQPGSLVGIVNAMVSSAASALARLIAPLNEQSFGAAEQVFRVSALLVSTTNVAARSTGLSKSAANADVLAR